MNEPTATSIATSNGGASASSNGNGEPSETASGFSLSLNAKGNVQFEVKFRYATPDEMLRRMSGDLNAAVSQIRLTVANLGMSLAG